MEEKGGWCNPAVMLFLKPQRKIMPHGSRRREQVVALVAMPSFKLELWQATRNDGDRWQLPTMLTCFLNAAAFLGAPFFLMMLRRCLELISDISRR